jgi:hypothetical protein
VIVRGKPPAALLADCPVEPYVPGRPWGDLALRGATNEQSHQACRCQLARLRAWSEDRDPQTVACPLD